MGFFVEFRQLDRRDLFRDWSWIIILSEFLFNFNQRIFIQFPNFPDTIVSLEIMIPKFNPYEFVVNKS